MVELKRSFILESVPRSLHNLSDHDQSTTVQINANKRTSYSMHSLTSVKKGSNNILIHLRQHKNYIRTRISNPLEERICFSSNL